MAELIDSHAHLLEVQKKSPDVFASFTKNFDPAVDLVLDVGISLADTPERLALNTQWGVKYWSLGLYPSHSLTPDWKDEVVRLEELISTYRNTGALGPRLVALGEIGIDHFRNYGPNQIHLFEAQIELAIDHNLPIIVHCRDAADDCYSSIKKYKGHIRGVMHCFSLDASWVEAFTDLDFFISFAGNVTYPANQNLVDAMKICPYERLLTESDCPYLAPVPHRGKTNTPLLTADTTAFIAKHRNIPIHHLNEQLNSNFMTLFG